MMGRAGKAKSGARAKMTDMTDLDEENVETSFTKKRIANAITIRIMATMAWTAADLAMSRAKVPHPPTSKIRMIGIPTNIKMVPRQASSDLVLILPIQ
jgi:hypothetical protein